MALFLSSYINKIDKKGRVSVPSQFRHALSMEEFNGIIIYKSFINNCLEACGLSRIEYISNNIDKLDPYSEIRDAFATAILGGCLQLSIDPEGRVLLPEEILAQSNLNEFAGFVGKGKTFEIWSPEEFKSHQEKARVLAGKERLMLHFNNAGDK